jgi:hypothetical protein
VCLDDVLRARVEGLSDAARALLETVAIASRPVPRRLAFVASGLKEADREVVQSLLGDHLLRTRGGGDTTLLEPFHDRIRGAVLGELSGFRLRQRHLDLARAMEALGSGDAETLTEHYCGAGRLDRAGVYAVTAARQAAEALAFERAVMLFRLSLRLRPVSDEEQRTLRSDLAAALAAGGRGAEAAEEYLALTSEADPDDVLDLRLRAAEQFISAGRTRPALKQLDVLARAVGVEVPGERVVVRRSSWMRRLRSVLGGGDSDPPKSPQPGLDEHARLRVDILEGFVSILRVLDPPRAMLVSERRLEAARAFGDRVRWARAAASHAALLAGEGAGNPKAVVALLAGARRVLAETEDALTRIIVCEAEADCAREAGAWGVAAERYEAAAVGLETVPAAGWLRARIARSAAWVEARLGHIHEFRARVRLGLDDAAARGDEVHAGAFKSGILVLGHLAYDDALSARASIAEAMDPFRNDEYLLSNFEGGLADTLTDLYVGDAPSAWRRVERSADLMARGFLVTRRGVGVEAEVLRARAALAAAAVQLRAEAGDEVAIHLLQPPPTPTAAPEGLLPTPATLLAETRRTAKRLERSRDEWVTGLAALLAAGERSLKGSPHESAAHLRRAVTRFDRCGMSMHAAVARHRMQAVDPAASADFDAAQEWFDAQGVINPGRISAVIAPGFSGPGSA